MLTIVVNGPSGEVAVDDYLDMLGAVVRALGDVTRGMATPRRRPTWNVNKLHTSEPTMLLEGRVPAGAPVNLHDVIEARYLRVLRALEQGDGTPQYLTETTMRGLYRVTGMFGQSPVAAITVRGGDGNRDTVRLTRETYRTLDRLLNATSQAIGSVTGIMATSTINQGRHFMVNDEVTDRGVRVDVDEDLLHEGSAWVERRVRIFGTVTRDGLDRPTAVKATRVELLPDDEEPMPLTSMRGAFPDFTGGMPAEEFIRMQRG